MYRKAVLFFAAALALLVPAGLFAGGGSESADSSVSELEFWTQPFASPENVPALQGLIDQFHAENPDIKVNITIPPANDDYRVKLLQDVSAGNAPDVGFVDGSWLPEFNVMGSLVPLDPWFDASMQNAYFDFAAEGATMDGQVKALWFHTGTSALYYRKDILAEAGYDAPPATWDEVIEMSANLTVDKNGDGIVDQYALGMPLNKDLVTAFLLGPLFWANGGEFSRGGKVAFGSGADKQAMLDMMNQIQSLVTGGAMPDSVVSTSFVDAEANFLGGQYAMCVLGSWQYASLRDNGGADFIDNIGLATIPAPAGQDPVACAGGWTLAMFTEDPAKQDAAWKWMEFFGGFEFQKTLTFEAAQMTSLIQVYETPEAAADPALPYFKDILLNGKTRDSVPFYSAMDDEYQVLLQTAVAGGDFSEAIDVSAARAQEKADEM